METYKIELKGLSDGTYEYEYHLDDNFFSTIEDAEVTKGDVRVQLLVKKIEGNFDFKFLLKGVVKVQCNRCLDEMDYQIDAENGFTVKYGKENIDEGDKLVITEDCNEIDLTWYLYEFVALELPITCTHAEGECNSEMESLLQKYSGAKESQEEGEPVDSRWSELKKLIDNN
ncbi:MAG: DUF177 domain-containing protein [Bacteroidales bacterium]|nr:DUF177 domain-containing protein [Bacteroidales bacterium]MBQ3577036.1 DUF177 domain-containing protein [Coprobacter sp.]